MFFPEKILNIKPSDYVLEIGPGSHPHPRSDVLLEKIFENKKIAKRQRGLTPEIKTDKKIIYYDGGKFPFSDKEFDYVICSHVIEHVIDVELFLEELFRIAKKGYLEYPLVYYDYIYNFAEHVTFLKYSNDTLYYSPKRETTLSDFYCIHQFFYESLVRGHSCLIDNLKEFFFEGFEWEESFKIKKTTKITELCWSSNTRIPPFIKNQTVIQRIKNKIVDIL